MARYNGKGTTVTTFNVKAYTPLDVRMIVETVADLTLDSTWTIDGALRTYNGMLTVVANDVAENCGVYYLQDASAPGKNDEPDHTNINNWHKLGTLADLDTVTDRVATIEASGAEFTAKLADLETTVNGVPASEGSEPVEGLIDKVAANTQAVLDESAARLEAEADLENKIAAALTEAKAYADEHDADTIYDDTEVRGQVATLTDHVTELEAAIEATNTALTKVVTTATFEEFKATNTTAINAAQQEATAAAIETIDTRGYITASEVAATYAEKATTLAGYGIVDAYTKAETVAKTDVYTKAEVNQLLDDVTGGTSESAASVKRALDSYIQSTDTELYGAELVASWTAEDGTYTPAYSEATSRIDTALSETAEVGETVANLTQAVTALETDVAKLVTRMDSIVQPRSSEEISVAADGTLGIEQVNVNKLTQASTDILVLDGGSINQYLQKRRDGQDSRGFVK